MNTGGQNRTERRLAAILAADVAGYSRLVGADEEGTLHRLRVMACFGAKRYADCIVWARTMAAKFPEDFRAFFLEASALAMQGDLTAATKAREILLRLRPRFTLSWMKENLPPIGELGKRLREGLRRAGVPEK